VFRFRIIGVRREVDRPVDAAFLEERLGLPRGSIRRVEILRRSLDARKKPILFREFSILVDVDRPFAEGPRSEEAAGWRIEPVPEPVPSPELLLPALERSKRVVVVGTGPAGLFAALRLAERGVAPTILERGDAAEERYRKVMRYWRSARLDAESNVQFGEGGAGTFSDGKLTCGKKASKVVVVLETFARFGAPPSILVEAKPHIGTDRLVVVLRNVRRWLVDRGCTIRYRARVADVAVDPRSGALRGLLLDDGEEIPADVAILALGHSSRDTIRRLFERGVPLSPKAFAAGVRIEHPQALIDEIQYGSRRPRYEDLPPADYRMTHVAKSTGRGVYTFCMCPGGEVIACASEAGSVVTNGMSRYRRSSGRANAGLVVQTLPDDFAAEPGPEVLRGIEWQRRLERSAFEAGGGNAFAPAQSVGSFLAGRLDSSLRPASYLPGVAPARLDLLLPAPYVESLREALVVFDRTMRGFASSEALLIAPESRTSSPVRIERDDSGQCLSIRGLFPAGEGAGFAGGIVSAALDGLRIADAVLELLGGAPSQARLAPPPLDSGGPESCC
jgi:uncharacterized FAD-dependent dehydrogenase